MVEYPGARWWKFDFHTHTPASLDTEAWQKAIGSPDEVTPEKWLLKYMAAEVDCVAVTDHNTGAWIELLKTAYAGMLATAASGEPPEGFRELTLFPGVELSVQGGVHVLAILDSSSSASDVDTLLGRVKYSAKKGDSDGVTTEGLEVVLREIREFGGLAIPAHADQEKGILQCQVDSTKILRDANTIKQALEGEGLLAVEWCDLSLAFPDCLKHHAPRLARVLGSDSHSFQGAKAPGGRYTWVKMATPTLEGLRLALLDGDDVSIRRSDGAPFDPSVVPEHWLSAIEVQEARFMGRGRPTRIECSPFFNAIVGGRGTGKSTLVHALRRATGRETELLKDSDPLAQFEAFTAVCKGRDGKGALRIDTSIRVEWQHSDTRSRLSWSAGSPQQRAVEDWCDGQWTTSASQVASPARFPLRLFSQGQIAVLAVDGRQTLLSIIDEAASVASLQSDFDDVRRAFFAKQAQLREVDAKVSALPEVERQLQELAKKLELLANSDHATVLRAFAAAKSEQREVEQLLAQANAAAQRLNTVAESLALDAWSSQVFSEHAELLAWREEVEGYFQNLRRNVQEHAASLLEQQEQWMRDARYQAWISNVNAAKQAHAALQDQLATQGVQDPQAFQNMTQDREVLEAKRKELVQLQSEKLKLISEVTALRSLLAMRRLAISDARRSFLAQVLKDNSHVRITVVPMGFEPRVLERELRELLEAQDERFAKDILQEDNGERAVGLAAELAGADDVTKLEVLASVRDRLLSVPDSFAGQFRKYLQKKHERPDFADQILAWFPEDDLKLEYEREAKWHPIEEGSQGQRSAALLAFLLSFGNEPIILDQPEDDLDNHLIYDLIVQQIRANKLRRQLFIVTHNANVVVNGDAELVHVMEFGRGQCILKQSGALQQAELRKEVCRVMEGGQEAFTRRWKRLGGEA